MAERDLQIIIKAQDFATKEIKKLQWEVRRFWNESKKATRNMSSGLSEVKSLALQVASAIGAIEIGKGIINLTNQLEQNTVAFTTMLWSAEEAKILLEDLSTFAAQTPFELTGIRQTAKQLLAFWFESQELIPTLKALWDVASGLSVPIEQIAYAYGQVRTANQLYWTELRQFMNAWVPLLAELADMFWKTEVEVKKMVESGLVWFNDVEKAFARMSWEWWAFFNLMDKQASTLGGKWSNLMDTIALTWETIGTSISDGLKDIVDSTKNFIESNQEAIINFWSDTLTFMMDIWRSVLEIFKTLLSWVNEFLAIFTGNTASSLSDSIENWKKFFLSVSLWFQSILIIANTGVKSFVWFVKAMGTWIWQFVNSIIDNVRLAVKNSANLVISFINEIIEAINMVSRFIWWGNLIAPLKKFDTELDKIAASAGLNGQEIVEAFNFEGIEASNQRIMWNMINSIDAFNSEIKLTSDSWRELNTTLNTSWNTALQSFDKWSSGAKKAKEETEDYKKEVKQLEDQMKDLSHVTDIAVKFSSRLYEGFKKVLSLDQTQKFIDSIQEEAKDAFDSITRSIEKSGDKIQDYERNIANLRKEIRAINDEIGTIGQEGTQDIATRLVEAQKELSELQNKSTLEWDDMATIRALKEEIKLWKSLVTDADIQQAKEEAQKSEIQKIHERMQLAIEEKKQERKLLKEQLREKLDALKEEENSYNLLVQNKKDLDKEYFEFFMEKIKEQQRETKETIRLLERMNQLQWGWNFVNNSPQVFNTPASSASTQSNNTNINVNLWGVTVSNQADENRLVEKIKQSFVQDARMFNLWIS